MEYYETLLADIAAETQKMKESKQKIYQHYSSLVEDVVAGHITDEGCIDKMMNGLSDFGDDMEFIKLNGKLCRHVYYNYPSLVGPFKAAFRLMFNEDSDEQTLT